MLPNTEPENIYFTQVYWIMTTVIILNLDFKIILVRYVLEQTAFTVDILQVEYIWHDISQIKNNQYYEYDMIAERM